MRDIKFRAWDNDFLKMHWFLEKSHNLPTPQPLHWYLEMKERFDIMQYTGLKDKNGKEIYEGDIITFGKYIKYRVIFEDSCFHLYHHEGLKEWDGTDYRWGPLYRIKELAFDVELVGNIYENHELL